MSMGEPRSYSGGQLEESWDAHGTIHLFSVLQEIGGQPLVREVIRCGRKQLILKVVLRVCIDEPFVYLACAVPPREDSTAR